MGLGGSCPGTRSFSRRIPVPGCRPCPRRRPPQRSRTSTPRKVSSAIAGPSGCPAASPSSIRSARCAAEPSGNRRAVAHYRRAIGAVQGGTNPHYLPTCHLVYAHDGRIFAVPFYPRRLRVTGAPRRARKRPSIYRRAAQFGVSRAAQPRTSAARCGAPGETGVGDARRRRHAVCRIQRLVQLAASVCPRARCSSQWRVRPQTSGCTTSGPGHCLSAPTTQALPSQCDASRTGGIQLHEERAAEPVHQRRLATRPLERLVASENVQIPSRGRPTDCCWRSSSGERHGTRHFSSAASISRGTTAADLARLRERSAILAGWPLARVRVERVRQNEVYLRTSSGEERGQRVSSAGGVEPVWASNGSELFYREATR